MRLNPNFLDLFDNKRILLGIGFSDYATPDNLRNPDKDLIKFIKSLTEKEAAEGKGNFSGPYFLLGFQSGGLDALAAVAELEGEGLVRELDDCHGICLKAAFFIAKISNVLLVDTVLPNFKERALQEVFGEAPEKAEAQMGDLLQRELETVQFLNRVRISTAQEFSLLHEQISPPGFSSPWPDPIAGVGEKHLLVAA